MLVLQQELRYLFLLSTCLNELLFSMPKVIAFLPHAPVSNENYERTSNPIQ